MRSAGLRLPGEIVDDGEGYVLVTSPSRDRLPTDTGIGVTVTEPSLGANADEVCCCDGRDNPSTVRSDMRPTKCPELLREKLDEQDKLIDKWLDIPSSVLLVASIA